MSESVKVSVLIPTYNAGLLWEKVLTAINSQDYAFHHKIVVDSGSRDETVIIAKNHGFNVITIDQQDFNHGGTRQLLADKAVDSDICLFVTQDAVLAFKDSVSNLIQAFDNPQTALAYGRQLPRENAKPIETHLRLFNYPEQSEVKSLKDKKERGFKVFFCSNSFAAYRKNSLTSIGGFPNDSIMGEDALVAAKMLEQGYNVAYVANALVYHSHSYTLKEDFKRYFDTRVFHEQNKWLTEQYGKPSGEGVKYVKSEISYVLKNHPASLPKAVGSLFAKWLGYTIAAYYKRLPASVIRRLSMHYSFWK